MPHVREPGGDEVGPRAVLDWRDGGIAKDLIAPADVLVAERDQHRALTVHDLAPDRQPDPGERALVKVTRQFGDLLVRSSPEADSSMQGVRSGGPRPRPKSDHCSRPTQCGTALAGVKAKPLGWPAAFPLASAPSPGKSAEPQEPRAGLTRWSATMAVADSRGAMPRMQVPGRD